MASTWNRVIGVVQPLVVALVFGVGLQFCGACFFGIGDRVEQMVVVGDRVLLQTEDSDDKLRLYASDDHGATWGELDDVPPRMSNAFGNELLAAHGSPDEYTAALWHSRDRGTTWSITQLVLLGGYAELFPQLPAAFVEDESGAPPLLMMANYQLVRPDPQNYEPNSWQRVGTPLPARGQTRGPLDDAVSAIRHRGSIYISVGAAIYHSADDASTWSTFPTNGMSSPLRCRDATCFVVLDDTLHATIVGTNDWKPVARLALPTLPSDPGFSEPFRRGTPLPTATGVYVVGNISGQHRTWGVMIHIDHAGTVTRIGRATRYGLHLVERGPDGAIWVGGDGGVFRVEGNDLVRVWPRANRSCEGACVPTWPDTVWN